MTTEDTPTTTTSTVRLVLSWLLVTVLLGYGIIQTLITAAKLFE
ncbi:MFS transporter small subunit [Paractinoplanes atraurantiacus]|uniref:Uncharacterized protein n=1 Tax=Paractinoplanes atraurantiacus TaxID=1036182 RepID=A0A285KFM8_9ACTN|nr:hypothetical protein [Actinoplanes atraurantiacus]SNY71420.1 hypothetical protein SAMN05421748_14024 [Actinoplanes atraurantiacus]